MFGLSFSEILIIAVIAVLFLGPDKLPQTMVKFAKFFKNFKNSINEAKESIEKEVKIAELKEDAQKYKQSFEDTKDKVRKKLSFEELDEIKKSTQSLNKDINEIKSSLTETKKPKPKKVEKKEENV